jgi:hypothetical protein
MLNLVFFMACPLSAFFTLSLSSPLPPSLAAWRRWLVDRDRRAMSAAFFSSLDILTDGPLGAVLRAASSSAPTLLRIWGGAGLSRPSLGGGAASDAAAAAAASLLDLSAARFFSFSASFCSLRRSVAFFVVSLFVRSAFSLGVAFTADSRGGGASHAPSVSRVLFSAALRSLCSFRRSSGVSRC